MKQELLNNVRFDYIHNTHLIKADINTDNPLVSHFLAIDVLIKDGDSSSTIASLDPWESHLEFRHKSDRTSQYKLVAKLTNNSSIFLTGWLSHDKL